MPVYTYRCGECGTQFERQQRFEDSALVTCPECGRPALQKVYTPVGIVFKGSGFYSTDHRSASGAESKSPAKSTGSAKADAKSDGSPSTAEAKDGSPAKPQTKKEAPPSEA
jgi:putative FmdB family regulatory protein